MLVAVLTALLGGSIQLDVFTEELPATGRSSYGWFMVAAGSWSDRPPMPDC